MLSQLRTRSALILAITKYEHRLSDSVEQFKAVAFLVDGSRLHVNEVWLNGTLRKYAYYWLTPSDEVIQGWDNAPHHPEVNTHPHHVHIAGEVHPSQVGSLADVLDILEQRLIS
jgi:hypothetical protein